MSDTRKNNRSAAWIGVDLDRTLAEYVTNEHGYDPLKIGEPLWPMVNRIKRWLADGEVVKIFTARASGFDLATVDGKAGLSIVRDAIQNWLEAECGLPRLDVTAEKDYRCKQIWDDIAVQMQPNTGVPLIASNR